MASSAELSILIKAKNEASAALQGVTKDVEGLGSKMGTALKVGGAVAAAGVGAAAYALAGFVKDAAAEQVGIAQLQTAIGNLSDAHKGAAASVEDLVRQREKLAFADDDIRASLALLIPATGDYQEAVDKQRIAMDVARGTGMDLATASRLVAKINDESVTAFQRYGVTIAKGSTETEALAAIQAKFSGQSEAYANTAAGKWELFGNQMDNIKESIGGALLPVVTQLGASLGDFLLRHQADIDKFSDALAKKIPEAIAAIKQGFDQARPALEFAFETMRSGFEAMRPALEWIVNNKIALVGTFTALGVAMILAFTPVTLPILAVVAAIGGLLFVVGLVRDHWDEIKRVTVDTWDAIRDAVVDRLGFLRGLFEFAFRYYSAVVFMVFETIKNDVTTAINVVRDIIAIVMALIHGDWGAAWDGVKALVGDVWNGIIADIGIKLDFLKAMMSLAWDVIKYVAAAGWNGIKDLAGELWGGIRDAIVEPVKEIIDWIQRIIDKAHDLANIGGLAGKLLGKAADLIGFAGGGIAPGGPIIVGERGPEIIAPPMGSRIYSNGESRALVSRSRESAPPVPAAPAAPAAPTIMQHIYISTYQNVGDPAAGLAALGMTMP